MEIVTLEEMLETLGENALAELESQGLASWTIGAAGESLTELLGSYSLADLEELREELLEGGKAQVTIDLSDAIINYLNEEIETREEQEADEDDEEDLEEYSEEDKED